MEPKDETRRLLKVFGVAVTDFEEESAKLLDRLRNLEEQGKPQALEVLRDVLELMLDVNGKWLAATDHLFTLQRNFIEEALKRIGK